MDSSATATWTRGIALAGLWAIALPPAAAGDAQPPQTQLSSPAADAKLIDALRKKGVRLETGQITAWFSPKAMPREDMNVLVDRLGKGVAALEAFLHTPRRWQESRPRRVEYFFDDGPFFIPHATVSGQVLIPMTRLREGQAPILHETTHALLSPPQGRRPLAWLTEGLAAYVAKSVAAQTGIEEGDRFELGDVPELDSKCAAGLSSDPGPKILPFIGAPGNLPVLYAMEPALVVRRVFYGCSASFTKYLIGRLGLERVVDVLPEDDPHKTLEALAGATMASLRSSWMESIGAKTPR